MRRNLAANLVSPLVMLAWLLAAQAVLAAPRSSTASVPPVPLVFEENRGQAEPRVKFLGRGAGYVLFITAAEAILADPRTGQAVRVHLRGARPDVEVAGLEPLPGRIHYIRGRDPARWRTGEATYGRVAYRDAYPGIDAIYKTTTGSRFEQEFTGGCPRCIRGAEPSIDPVPVRPGGPERPERPRRGVYVSYAPIPDGDILKITAGGVTTVFASGFGRPEFLTFGPPR